jgi:hypothetical protein
MILLSSLLFHRDTCSLVLSLSGLLFIFLVLTFLLTPIVLSNPLTRPGSIRLQLKTHQNLASESTILTSG